MALPSAAMHSSGMIFRNGLRVGALVTCGAHLALRAIASATHLASINLGSLQCLVLLIKAGITLASSYGSCIAHLMLISFITLHLNSVGCNSFNRLVHRTLPTYLSFTHLRTCMPRDTVVAVLCWFVRICRSHSV